MPLSFGTIILTSGTSSGEVEKRGCRFEGSSFLGGVIVRAASVESKRCAISQESNTGMPNMCVVGLQRLKGHGKSHKFQKWLKKHTRFLVLMILSLSILQSYESHVIVCITIPHIIIS
jgi:hypothetical protein